MKKTLALMLAVLLIASFVGCTTAAEPAAASPEAAAAEAAATEANAGVAVTGVPFAQNPNLSDGKNVLGIAWSSWAAEATQILIADFEASYKDYGFDEIISVQAENDVETQISQIQDLANQGVDIMIVNSVDPDGIVAVVDSVQAMGIPVMAVDRRINTPLYYSFETDNYAAGVDLCKYVAGVTEHLGEEVKVFAMQSNATSSAVRDRHQGWADEMKYWPHLNQVGEVALESSIENCYNATVDAFKVNPDIKVVMVSGDNYVAPVVSALTDIGKFYPYGDPNHVMICSFDGAPSALKYMVDGANDAVANQRFDLFCHDPLRVAQDYINGTVVDIGANDIKLDTPIVTPKNIETLKELGILWGYNF